MRIGVDGRCLLEKYPSGVSQYAVALLRTLIADDRENHYIIFVSGYRRPPQVVWSLAAANADIVWRRIPNKLLNFSIRFFSRPRVDRLLPAIDLLLVPANNFISWSAAVKKLIVCHDISWLAVPDLYSRKGRWWHRLLSIEARYIEADRIVAVSDFTKQELTRILPGIAADKISVIPSGSLPLTAAEVDGRGSATERIWPREYILFVGNIEPRKNIEAVIESFQLVAADFPDLHLIIVGGSGWHRAYARRIIALARRHPRTIYLGYVSEAVKRQLYEQARVFLFLSVYEGFGFPPLEAMRAGTPVIAAHTTSLPEVVGNAAWLVNPYDLNEITAGLRRLLTDDVLRQRLQAAGQARSRLFVWERTGTMFRQLFSTLRSDI